jgi:periplasmic divalent cation tolerance protein
MAESLCWSRINQDKAAAMSEPKACVVMVTAPNREEAERLARAALEARLAACVQLQPIASFYWWEGKITSDSELLLLFKTVPARFAALRDLILQHHSYDTPEIISLPVEDGAERYLNWIGQQATG